MFSFVSRHNTVFQRGFTILHSHQQWMTISVAAHPCQTLVSAIYVPDFGQVNKCVVISHCWLNLHFPDDIWHETSFYMPICHFYFFFFFGELSVKVFVLYIFFGDVFIKVSGLFLNLTVFLLLTFKSCLFLVTVLYLICLLQIFTFRLWLTSVFSWQCLLQSRNF